MLLEAVVFPQETLNYGCKDYLYSLIETTPSEGSWNHNYGCKTTEEKDLFGLINNNLDHKIHSNCDSSSPSVVQNVKDQWDSNSSPETSTLPLYTVEASITTTNRRRKRRRTKNAKNDEEIENQRMTHIAVERNRRKQMNEYLAVLRALMPPSYVHRGDQASIIGGAINFLKELEQHLQCMKGQKKITEKQQENGFNSSSPFAEFFTFPQYSTCTTQSKTCYPTNQNQSRAMADIEVTLVDSHANIKILLTKRSHGQVMKMVVGLQNLGFNILHLNVTTLDDMILVSVSVKVEEGCELNTVDEIAAAVNQLSRTIQVEAAGFEN